MIAVKISRESRIGKRDNRVDMAGYAECLDMVREERFRREDLVTTFGPLEETEAA